MQGTEYWYQMLIESPQELESLVVRQQTISVFVQEKTEQEVQDEQKRDHAFL